MSLKSHCAPYRQGFVRRTGGQYSRTWLCWGQYIARSNFVCVGMRQLSAGWGLLVARLLRMGSLVARLLRKGLLEARLLRIGVLVAA